MIVGASMRAFLLFNSNERYFPQRVYYLCGRAKCPLLHSWLGSQTAVRKSTPARWIANQKFVPELVRGNACFTFDSTDPEQDGFANWHEIR
jgi:hypothetical protein